MMKFDQKSCLRFRYGGRFAWALAIGACHSGDTSSFQDEQASVLTGGLPKLNIEVGETSVSGLSAGGYMAVQFHVAYSSIMRGAGIFAGGPYHCAEGSLSTALTTCMTASPSAPDPSRAVASTRQFADANAIDAVSNLARQRVFLFGGANDATVVPAVVDSLEQYYRSWISGPSGHIRYENRRPATAHTMPTVDYGGSCSITGEPWIGRCNYDGVGMALAEIYGTVQPPASRLSGPASPSASLTGQFVSVSQGAFVSNPASHSLADTGYAYIPKSCSDGASCRVHIAFHGCKQYASGSVGDKYYKHAGYNPWADTNRLVVLYPQTIPTSGSNPNGCWDWWGYDSPNYSKRNGPQMLMVRKMIDALAGTGAGDAGVGDAGAGDAGAGDAGANDAGSQTDAGTTCFVANNYSHVAAGRAYVAWGYAIAKGSNQNIGLYSVGVVTSLRRVGPDHYVLGTCP